MRFWMPALAAAGLVLGIALAGPGVAQMPKPPGGGAPGGGGPGGGGPGGGGGGAPKPAPDQFIFKVCNKTKIPLFVAMLYKVGGEQWRYVGWADYGPNDCGPGKGAFPRDFFYWYAEDGPAKVTFPGKDAQGCVNQDDSFDRTISGDYSCQPGEKIVGFHKITPQQIENGITLQ